MIYEIAKQLLKNLNENGLAYGLVCALSAWLGQTLASRISRREDAAIRERLAKVEADLSSTQSKLAGRIERAVHVHKVQFEKEFAIYQTLMRDIRAFHLVFSTLHRALQPPFDSEKETDDYYAPLREKEFRSFETLRETIWENRPFYATEIYTKADKLLALALSDVASLKTKPRTGFLPFEEIEKLKKQTEAAVDAVVESIRDRLNSLVVVE